MTSSANKQHYPDILHHGAVSGTTGSCHELLYDEQHSVLVHCGLFQGADVSPHGPILAAPKSPYGCDTLVIESTYGDRQHEDRRQRLQKVIARALQDQGTVLIPAFSIGRTQELIYELEDIIYRNHDSKAGAGLKWSELPIILDSPLVSRLTQVYRELTPFWEAGALKRVLAEGL